MLVKCLQICTHVFIDRPQNCDQTSFRSCAGLRPNFGHSRSKLYPIMCRLRTKLCPNFGCSRARLCPISFAPGPFPNLAGTLIIMALIVFLAFFPPCMPLEPLKALCIPILARAFPYSPVRSPSRPCVPLLARAFPYSPVRSPTRPCVPLLARAFPYSPVRSPTCPCIPLFARAFPYSPERSPTRPCVPLLARVFPYSPVCSPTRPCVPLLARAFPYSPMRSPTRPCVPLLARAFPYSPVRSPTRPCVPALCSRARRLTNTETRAKRTSLFGVEQARQVALVRRLEKIEVAHRGPPEECLLLMNKGLSTPFNCAMRESLRVHS